MNSLDDTKLPLASSHVACPHNKHRIRASARGEPVHAAPHHFSPTRNTGTQLPPTVHHTVACYYVGASQLALGERGTATSRKSAHEVRSATPHACRSADVQVRTYQCAHAAAPRHTPRHNHASPAACRQDAVTECATLSGCPCSPPAAHLHLHPLACLPARTHARPSARLHVPLCAAPRATCPP